MTQPKLLYRIRGMMLSPKLTASSYALVYETEPKTFIGIMHQGLHENPHEPYFLHPYLENRGNLMIRHTQPNRPEENFWLTLAHESSENEWCGACGNIRFRYLIEPADETDVNWSQKYGHNYFLARGDRRARSFSMAINCPRRRVGPYYRLF